MRFIKLNGHSVGIVKSNEDNTLITISGWVSDYRDLKVNEVVAVISSNDVSKYYTYKIIKTDFPSNVKDQFFIDLAWVKSQ
jgi:hypothetical protein